MFKSIDDVKKWIAKTIKQYSKKFVVNDYAIQYSNRMSRALGITSTRYFAGFPIRITFKFNNKYLASFKDNEGNIKDTVLHEIAHAIAGSHHHHDAVWKSCCIAVGCKPNRCKHVTY